MVQKKFQEVAEPLCMLPGRRPLLHIAQQKVLRCTESCLGGGSAARAGQFAAWRALVHRQTFSSQIRRHMSALKGQCPGTGLFYVTCNAVRLPIRAAERTVALLAFENAASSPVADLMDAAQRQKTASEVNAAILKSQHQVGPAHGPSSFIDEQVPSWALLLADLQECEARLPGLLKMMLWAQSQLDGHCTFPHITDLMSGTLSDPAAASE